MPTNFVIIIKTSNIIFIYFIIKFILDIILIIKIKKIYLLPNNNFINNLMNYIMEKRNATKKKNVIPVIKGVSETATKMISLVKFNADIKRKTYLGIIKYLKDAGIAKNTDSIFIEFGWNNKFKIVINGLGREYFYSETFFLNALVDSFKWFAEDAGKIINAYYDESNKENDEPADTANTEDTAAEDNSSKSDN